MSNVPAPAAHGRPSVRATVLARSQRRTDRPRSPSLRTQASGHPPAGAGRGGTKSPRAATATAATAARAGLSLRPKAQDTQLGNCVMRRRRTPPRKKSVTAKWHEWGGDGRAGDQATTAQCARRQRDVSGTSTGTHRRRGASFAHLLVPFLGEAVAAVADLALRRPVRARQSSLVVVALRANLRGACATGGFSPHERVVLEAQGAPARREQTLLWAPMSKAAEQRAVASTPPCLEVPIAQVGGLAAEEGCRVGEQRWVRRFAFLFSDWSSKISA